LFINNLHKKDNYSGVYDVTAERQIDNT